MSEDVFTVGVTGTNGKTTTTTWIALALATLAAPVARMTTLGFFVGEEQRVIGRTFEDFVAAMAAHRGRYAAIELTSEALAQGFARAWHCHIGVFTNLSHDHLDTHGSPEHYLASKAQLFVNLAPGDTAVLNAADPVFELLREVIPPGVRVLSYAVPSRGVPSVDPDLFAREVQVSWSGTRIVCDGLTIGIRAIGEVYAENALAAVLAATAAGVPIRDACAALADAEAPPGRFQVVNERPYVVVDFAHSPDSLARTLHTARSLGAGQVFVVFGAGGNRDREKRGPMGEAARAADHLILTSDNPRDEDPAHIASAIAEGLRGHPSVRTELDRARAVMLAIREAKPDDVVLIAGKGPEDIELARAALT